MVPSGTFYIGEIKRKNKMSNIIKGTRLITGEEAKVFSDTIDTLRRLVH